MIIHIPHASEIIPQPFRDQFVLLDEELAAELLRMTDHFTDELFAFVPATTLRFSLSRLVVDVERFAEDTKEPMSQVGMGMIYTRTAYGNALKRTIQPHERQRLLKCYQEHHDKLSDEVIIELDRIGLTLIIDCHSFPSKPLPCDMDQRTPRPEFCIGTDPYHTPPDLVEIAANHLVKLGYRVEIDRPYAGTLVSMGFYKKDRRVLSMMIEVNRRLYMDETTGAKTDSFESVRAHLHTLLVAMNDYQYS